MAKLKTVSVAFDYVILVEDDNVKERISVARDNFREACSNAYFDDIEASIEDYNEDSPPDGWGSDCIPYGGDGNTTIGELINEY